MTERADRPVHELPDSISVDWDPNNRIQIGVYTDILTGDGIVLVLEVEAVLNLLRDLANTTASCATRAARDIATGDCPTCRNTRLVDVQTSTGRVSNERCPDCGPRWNASSNNPFARPRIGGGIS